MAAKNKNPAKTLLIVDDHPMMRTGLAQLIDNEPDLKVCAEADNAAQALDAVTNHQFDLILLDISLPDRNGLELIKDIQALKPELPILVVSMHDEMLYAERVLRAGARGYIMKESGSENLLIAIRRVLSGTIYVSDTLAAKMLQQQIRGQTNINESPVKSLSDRELEVFQLIGQWKTTRDIADELHLSVKTIEYYREQIKRKLNLKNAAELTQRATSWVGREATR